MSFRVLVVCAFVFSCDPYPGVIERSSVTSNPNEGVTRAEFGHYELQRLDEDPQGLPNGGFANAVFIAKTAANISLIFAEGMTWEYDEEADKVKEIALTDTAKERMEALRVGSEPMEQMFYPVTTNVFWELRRDSGEPDSTKDDSSWKLVRHVEAGIAGEMDDRYSIKGGYYEEKTPRILYLSEKKALLYSKKKLFLFSDELKKGSGDRGIVLSRSDNKNTDIVTGAENYLVGGICDDGKSVWMKSQRDARVILYNGYLTVKDKDGNIVYEKDEEGNEQKDEQGKKIEKKEHTFFPPTRVTMTVNENVGKPIFGMQVAIKENEMVQEGVLVGVNEDGELLIGEKKEPEEDEE